MVTKRLFCLLITLFLSVSMITPSAFAVSGTRSADVVSVALSQMGFREEANEFTKYGEWYGIPHGYWCDMFVSWCAAQAGIPKSTIPATALCATHVKQFTNMGCFEKAVSRGGTYTPRQGDLAFFAAPDSSRSHHVGIVLYVENNHVFVIEGNALSTRLDCLDTFLMNKRDESQDPLDYVTVNHYPLDYIRLLGYGVPKYENRDLLKLNGFVDLGANSEQSEIYETLCEEQIMTPTSANTFSPRYGMSRGEFLSCVVKLYGLKGWNSSTEAFSDVSQDHPYYEAIMAARSAGIIQGCGNNCFIPDSYISGAAAQAILSRTLDYLELENCTFTFDNGDYIDYGTYTTRASIAEALYALHNTLSSPKAYSANILLNDEFQQWNPMQINGSCYVPYQALQSVFPDFSMELPEAKEILRDPSYDRVHVRTQACVYQENTMDIPSFTINGEMYLMLRPVSDLLQMELLWDESTFSIFLSK